MSEMIITPVVIVDVTSTNPEIVSPPPPPVMVATSVTVI